MPVYIIPDGKIADETMSTITRSQVPLIAGPVLAEMIAAGSDAPIAILSLTEEQLQVLVRNMSHFVSEAPTFVTAVPGLQYRSTWMMTASKLFPVDWTELESKLLKSGSRAPDVPTIETRSREKESRTHSASRLDDFSKALEAHGNPGGHPSDSEPDTDQV